MRKLYIKTKLRYGVGINDADYVTDTRVNGKHVQCPFYSSWIKMLCRCYSAACKSRQPTYEGCSVCEEWFTFSNFKSWMLTQDWEGKALDKDIIKPGNKIYGPDNCAFVTQAVNNLLTHCRKSSVYPVGAYYCADQGKYHVRVHRRGKRVRLGYFDTPKEAARVYALAKAKHINEIANEQKDPRVKKGLRLHAGLLLDSV